MAVRERRHDMSSYREQTEDSEPLVLPVPEFPRNLSPGNHMNSQWLT